MNILKRVAKAVTKQVEKRAGLHVYRPVMNAQKWAEWMTASGVPGAKSADELRVTVFQATGNVAVIPDTKCEVIRSTSCVFAEYGATGLALVWYDYLYYDRHWALRELAGSEICCSTTRAVLLLSDDIGDFELTDEMLATVPPSIVLDGERTESLTIDQLNIQKSARGAAAVTPTEAQKAKAKAALFASYDEAEPNPMDQAILYDLSNGHSVLKADIESAGDDVRAALDLEAKEPVEETKPEPTPEPAPETKPVEKSQTRQVVKSDDRRIIYGWATVSHKDGESVIDYADDEITVDAMHQLAHTVVKGQRAGAFEHDPSTIGRTEIVECLVFDDAMCEALSAYSLNGPIKLDRQAVLIGQHIPGDEDWADAQDGEWEFSINANVTVIEKEAA